MISITGRIFPAPEYDVSLEAGGVFIRIDDANNAEAWVQVFIPWEELSRWISQKLRMEGIQDAICVDPPPATSSNGPTP